MEIWKTLQRHKMRLLHKIAKWAGVKGTLDSEKVLREKNHEILRLQELLIACRDSLSHHQPTITIEASPHAPDSRATTTGKIYGIRQRAITRVLQAHPGTLTRHHEHMLEQKERAQQTGPLTAHSLPRMPRKATFKALDDDFLL